MVVWPGWPRAPAVRHRTDAAPRARPPRLQPPEPAAEMELPWPQTQLPPPAPVVPVPLPPLSRLAGPSSVDPWDETPWPRGSHARNSTITGTDMKAFNPTPEQPTADRRQPASHGRRAVLTGHRMAAYNPGRDPLF